MAYGDSGASDVGGAEDGETVKTNSPVQDLLPLVREEMRRAVGFEQDAVLLSDRQRALNYFKGDVSQDIPALPNRSTAVSSDVADAVETLLPDLIEIFIGGDDVVSLNPHNAEDVDAAKQETAYLHHVAFQENPGFLNLHTAFQDALLEKTGIFHWEWQEEILEDYEDFTGKNAVEFTLASQNGEVSNFKTDGVGQDGAPTYSFRVTKTKDNSQAKYWAIRPEDFAAAPDTVYIQDATYCCERQRPRVQDLIADGFDAAKVRALEPYTAVSDQTTQRSRDTAGETDRAGGAGDDTSTDLRQVEIRKHCIRVLGESEDKLELWCVYTDSQATVELYREQINEIPYAVGSPYLVAHRLIGRSVADLLIEVQKIKTALYRMMLDSGYFALNQRHEVSMDKANNFTISDLLRNEPMVPVRSKTGDAVRSLNGPGLAFDAYAAIEFFSTVAEGRTGIVRNAQGLNPDTLHDTAKGALMLLSAAQKRTRMIARVLSETLLKPLFLGLHACIRENCTSSRIAQLAGKWVEVDPTKWAERNGMSVEVGLGAAGKDAELAAMNQIQGMQKLLVEGGFGQIVTPQNLYKSATDSAKKLGSKSPEEYFTDPDSDTGKQIAQAMAQKPNPEVEKANAMAQADMAKTQQDGQLKVAQMQQDGRIKQAQSQADAQLQLQKQQGELELKRYQTDQELLLKREQLQAELQLKREQMAAELALKRELGAMQLQQQSTDIGRVDVGGQPG